VARTKGTGAWPLATLEHGSSRGGGTTERGEHGELGSGLTGAQAAARWLTDGGKWRWRSVLDGVGVADSGASKGGRG
jgi:hypothetical protein